MRKLIPGKATAMLPVLLIFALNSLVSFAAPNTSQRSAVIETARKYLSHGLVEHKPNLVPLAENCWRLEQGRNTGGSGAEIKQRLLRSEYKVITGISNERWLVEGTEAVVFYDLHISTADKPVMIAERFKVVDGLIEEIEALFVQPGSGIEMPVRLSGEQITAAFAGVRDDAVVQDSPDTRAQNIWYADGRFVNEWSGPEGSGKVSGRWRVQGDERCVLISTGLPGRIGEEVCSPVYRLGRSYLSVNRDGSIHGVHTLSSLAGTD